MKRNVLFGIFLLIIGIGLIITYFTTKQNSYAYTVLKNYAVTFNYILEDNFVSTADSSYFQILDEDYHIISSFELKVNDSITIDSLDQKRYVLRQMKTDENYEPIEDFYFEVSKEKNLVDIITKKITNPKIAILLMDIETNKILVGGEFHLLDLENNLIDSCTTISGYCYMNNIESGSYTLENVIAPLGYTLINNEKVAIDDTLKTNYLELYTKPTKLAISFMDSDNNYLIKGGTYKLYDYNYNELFVIKYPNYEVKNLEEGVYYLEEITTPIGYSRHQYLTKFEVKNNSDNLKLELFYTRIKASSFKIDIFYLMGITFLLIGTTIFCLEKNIFKKIFHTKNR